MNCEEYMTKEFVIETINLFINELENIKNNILENIDLDFYEMSDEDYAYNDGVNYCIDVINEKIKQLKEQIENYKIKETIKNEQ